MIVHQNAEKRGKKEEIFSRSKFFFCFREIAWERSRTRMYKKNLNAVIVFDILKVEIRYPLAGNHILLIKYLYVQLLSAPRARYRYINREERKKRRPAHTEKEIQQLGPRPVNKYYQHIYIFFSLPRAYIRRTHSCSGKWTHPYSVLWWPRTNISSETSFYNLLYRKKRIFPLWKSPQLAPT